LLAVLVFPVVDLFEMRLRIETLQLIFLGGTLSIGVLNYLPTRAGAAALLTGIGCGLALLDLAASGRDEMIELMAGICLAVAPWAAWLLLRRRRQRRDIDRVWLNFRDSFGVVWGQRVREQMNRAAVNAQWPVILYWHGFHDTSPTPPDEQAVLDTLRALLRRFESEGHLL